MTSMSHQTRVLVAEDNTGSRMFLTDVLEDEGYEVLEAKDGVDALEVLEKIDGEVDALVLDLNMPRMGGLELLQKIKSHKKYARIPVIIQSGNSDPTMVQNSLKFGAYYFLLKPVDMIVFSTIVKSAIEELHNYKKTKKRALQNEETVCLMKEGRFSFKTEPEAVAIAGMLSQLCPNPRNQLLGLSELMVNAVEHGNLEISCQEKHDLISDRKLGDEISKRLVDPKYADRFASVEFICDQDEITFTITDMGKGFDWKTHVFNLEEQLFKASGRGIALAKLVSFNKVEYKGAGNEVVASVYTNPEKTSGIHVNDEANSKNLETETSVETKGLDVSENELETAAAAAMQKCFLPRKDNVEAINEAYNLKITSYFQPFYDLGGDFFGIHPISDTLFSLYVIDFSGKGPEAAAYTVWVDGAMRFLSQITTDPGTVLSKLNTSLFQVMQNDRYATMLYGIMDIEKNIFTYSTAGAPLPIVVDTNAELHVEMGEGSGLPIGFIECAIYENMEIEVPVGSSLYLYSDGLIENPDKKEGKIIGRAGAVEFFKQVLEKQSPPYNTENITTPFLNETSQPLQDDVTLLCCNRSMSS